MKKAAVPKENASQDKDGEIRHQSQDSIKHRNQLWHITNKGAAAEIGVAEGRFALEMVQWPTTTKLYIVDSWKCIKGQKGDGGFSQAWHDDNFKQAKDRLRPFKHKVEILKGISDQMAEFVENESLTFLSIDADHSYGGVLNDLRAWVPKVVKGGVVTLHDYLNPNYGVMKAVQEFCHRRYVVHLLPELRKEDAGAWFRV